MGDQVGGFVATVSCVGAILLPTQLLVAALGPSLGHAAFMAYGVWGYTVTMTVAASVAAGCGAAVIARYNLCARSGVVGVVFAALANATVHLFQLGVSTRSESWAGAGFLALVAVVAGLVGLFFTRRRRLRKSK